MKFDSVPATVRQARFEKQFYEVWFSFDLSCSMTSDRARYYWTAEHCLTVVERWTGLKVMARWNTG